MVDFECGSIGHQDISCATKVKSAKIMGVICVGSENTRIEVNSQIEHAVTEE